jgi:hypothetical protein
LNRPACEEFEKILYAASRFPALLTQRATQRSKEYMPQGQFGVVLRYLRQVAGTPVSGEISDADLLSRFSVSGDEAAFELLLWRHGAMVLRLCGM